MTSFTKVERWKGVQKRIERPAFVVPPFGYVQGSRRAEKPPLTLNERSLLAWMALIANN